MSSTETTHKRVPGAGSHASAQRTLLPNRIWIQADTRKPLPGIFLTAKTRTPEMIDLFGDITSRCAGCIQRRGKHEDSCKVNSAAAAENVGTGGGMLRYGTKAVPADQAAVSHGDAATSSTTMDAPLLPAPSTTMSMQPIGSSENISVPSATTAVPVPPSMRISTSTAASTTTRSNVASVSQAQAPGVTNDDDGDISEEEDEEDDEDAEVDKGKDADENENENENARYLQDTFAEMERDNAALKSAGRSERFSYVIPSPLQLSTAMWEWRLSAAAHTFAGSVLTIIDPQRTHPGFCTNIKCECKKYLHGNGYAESFRIVKSLNGIMRVLKLKRYRCDDCSEAKKKGRSISTYHALSPYVQSGLHPLIRNSEFILATERSSLPVSDLHLVQILVEYGASFMSIAKASRHVNHSRAIALEIQRMSMFENEKNTYYKKPDSFPERTAFENKWLCVVTARSMKFHYYTEAKRQEPYIQALLLSNVRTTTVMASDHTFPWRSLGNRWGAICIWVICDGLGRPILARACNDKSIISVMPLIRQVSELSEGNIKFWFTDNAGGEANSIKEACPSATPLQDLFHVKQRLNDCVPRGNAHGNQWRRAVCNAIFAFDANDVTSHIGIYPDLPNIAALCADANYLKGQASIRRSVRPAEEIEQSLALAVSTFMFKNCFLTKSKKGKPQGVNDILEVTHEISEQLRFLDYPQDFPWHLNVSRDPAVKKYVSVKGTSKVENVNGRINQADIARYEALLAHCVLLRVCVRRYLDISRTVTQLDIPDNVTDVTLFNALIQKYKTFEKRGWMQNVKRVCEDAAYIQPVTSERYLTSIVDVSGSMLTKAKALLKGESKVESKTKAPTEFRTDEETLATLEVPAADGFSESRTIEGKVVRAAIASGRYFKVRKDYHLYILEGCLKPAFWDGMLNSTPDAVLNLPSLSIHYNCSLLELLVNRAKDPHVSCSFFGVTVNSLSDFRMKEPIHISQFLKLYAVGVEKASATLAVKATTSIHVRSDAIVGLAPKQAVQSTEGHVHSSAFLPLIEHDNDFTLPSQKKKKRSIAVALASDAQPVAAVAKLLPVFNVASDVLSVETSTTSIEPPSASDLGKLKQQPRRPCPACSMKQHNTVEQKKCEFYQLSQTFGGGGAGRYDKALKAWNDRNQHSGES